MLKEHDAGDCYTMVRLNVMSSASAVSVERNLAKNGGSLKERSYRCSFFGPWRACDDGPTEGTGYSSNIGGCSDTVPWNGVSRSCDFNQRAMLPGIYATDQTVD